MTTIAYRDGIMAADSGEFLDDVHTGSTQKLFKIAGSIVGGCGDADELQIAIDWFERGEPADDRPALSEDDRGPLLLVLRPDRSLWTFGWRLFGTRVDAAQYAIGNGYQIALGAMAAGASAEEALRICCRLDAFTREPVQTMTLPETPAAASPRGRRSQRR